MSESPVKLLIASHHDGFLGSHIEELKGRYDVQVATTPDMTTFLVKEWGPQICLLDGDSSTFDTLNSIRGLRGRDSLSLFVFSKEFSLYKEEQAFRADADHFLMIQRLDVKSLCWRIDAVLARMGGGNSQAILQFDSGRRDSGADNLVHFGNIKIYPKDYIIKHNDKVIMATPTQFKLLLAFVSHCDQLLTREWIKQTVWDNSDISPRSIDAQISKLKKLLPELDRYLANVYGKGYILSPPQQDEAA